ncbi:protein O-mannose kinase-like [Patiria miniata]|uniref:Protein O-mannose kinase n=1 Tax=Patiria miniata TaxID=46514 RepID=A0A913Z0C2_PATMI|nr:protein O-mannose kinase-like [Patiria miniata]XP_038045364.1 protein O-mannose kinase-like [Patiria miniata]
MKLPWRYGISCVLLTTGLTVAYIWCGKFASFPEEINPSKLSLSDTQCQQREQEEPCIDGGVDSLMRARSCHGDRDEENSSPYLGCQEMEEIRLEKKIGQGAVKEVYLGEWQGMKVAYSSLIQSQHLEDFLHGAKMLQALQPHELVVGLIGLCLRADKPVIVTEYHQLGSADRVEDILSQESFRDNNTIKTRFQLCLDYIRILLYLHSGPAGMRIMCDSNDVDKTLSQFLITNDLTLVVNDLDALPLVDRAAGKLAKCGHRQLWGEFVAPEQLWPFPEREFQDEEMASYDEKTDIWKVPDVTDALLGNVAHANIVRFHLFKIHQQCKELDPTLRPTAGRILEAYLEVFHSVVIDDH